VNPSRCSLTILREQILPSSPSCIWIPFLLSPYPLLEGRRVNGRGAESVNKQYKERTSLAGFLELYGNLKHAMNISTKLRLGRNINYEWCYQQKNTLFY
jgi:hypothetical protein